MCTDWATAGTEPALDDILRDPITRALMRSDNVDADHVRLVTIAARQRIRTAIPHAAREGAL